MSGNKIAGRNWQHIHAVKKKWKRAAGMAAIAAGKPPAPLPKAEITFTRHSSQEIDLDNLAISFKPICDALVAAGIIEDDAPSVATILYAWQKCPRGQGKISVEVRG